jgi:uridine phosphorylase
MVKTGGGTVEEQYHLRLKPGDVGRYVLLPGDPGRCKLIAGYFDTAQLVAQNREYTTYTGTLLGERVSVTSTGIGAPSTAIAVEELARVGGDTFLRVGTAGGVHPSARSGDLVIATGAVRDEGTSRQYVPIEFPALAHLEIVNALHAAVTRSRNRFHLGVVHSKDSFYGEVEMERMPCAGQLQERWLAWVRARVICSEMEAAALFVVAHFLGHRAGGLMQVISPAPETTGENDHVKGQSDWLSAEKHVAHDERLIKTAIEGLKQLINDDRQRVS